MNWQQLTLYVIGPDALRVSQALEDCGALAISFFDAQDQPLLEPPPNAMPLWDELKLVGLFADEDITAIQVRLLVDFPDIKMEYALLPDQEWTTSWMAYFKPMAFGNLWIVPEGDSSFVAPHDSVLLRLNPGLAFGAGTHPTTALCLGWLANYPPKNVTVIDYGCGSGILGIAALLLGASHVSAIDYDSQAITSTLENARRNDLKKLTVGAPDMIVKPAQLIMANILLQPLIELAPYFNTHCTTGGKIILSGILKDQISLLLAAYQPWFVFEAPIYQEEWVLLVGQKI